MKHTAVVIAKGAEEHYFSSMMDAANHLGVTRKRVVYAVANKKSLDGWRIEKAGDRQREMTPGREPRPRYSEIFARKPFEATGIWGKRDA